MDLDIPKFMGWIWVFRGISHIVEVPQIRLIWVHSGWLHQSLQRYFYGKLNGENCSNQDDFV